MNGGTIHIQKGVYKETLNIDKHVRLIGEGADNTILDGERKHRCITIKTEHKVLVEGLTITHGEGWVFGGGIYNEYGKIIIKNCLITNNRVYTNYISEGGGIYSYYGCIVVENSTIQNNDHVGYGGGIDSYSSVLVIRDSIIQNNSCSEKGGGISAWYWSLVIVNSLIQNNFAEYGGGIDFQSADVTIKHSIFQGNTATKLGGGIHSILSQIHLDDTTQFVGNYAPIEPDIW